MNQWIVWTKNQTNGFKQAFKFKDDSQYKYGTWAIRVRRVIENLENIYHIKNKLELMEDFKDLFQTKINDMKIKIYLEYILEKNS